MYGFLKGFLVGILFWSVIFLSFASKADDLPPNPYGKTLTINGQLNECYPTDEFRKIVLWVETARHLHVVNSDLNILVDTTRAELTVVSQENAIRASQLKVNLDEIARLRALVNEQQAEQAKLVRRDRAKTALTWTSVGLLIGGIVVVGLVIGLKGAQ